ncbi:hypothetical protein DY000_02036727 [Brassica cretica]|uniref:Protein kinase domain-containing protein n=1 Tax=Brassica cretica TaxID=69181 RepID=A0ABQ7BLL8_BRACR|nr:hypothetical protein DY000_02036727 [Brassica cretica]
MFAPTKVSDYICYDLKEIIKPFKCSSNRKIGLGLTGFGVFLYIPGSHRHGKYTLLSWCHFDHWNSTSHPILYKTAQLLSGFWPTFAVFLQRILVLGWLLQHPYIRSLLDRYRGRRVPV